MLFDKIILVFYAVAAADGLVRPEELKVLKRVVKEKWFSGDNVPLCEVLIPQIFQELQQQGVSSHEAFDEFREYYQQHRNEFSQEHKAKLAETAAAVAAAFAGNNKSELTVLAQLYLLLHDKDRVP